MISLHHGPLNRCIILHQWSQKEIGEVMGLGRTAVTEVVKKFSSEEIDTIRREFAEGKPIEKIAIMFGGSKTTHGGS